LVGGRGALFVIGFLALCRTSWAIAVGWCREDYSRAGFRHDFQGERFQRQRQRSSKCVLPAFSACSSLVCPRICCEVASYVYQPVSIFVLGGLFVAVADAVFCDWRRRALGASLFPRIDRILPLVVLAALF